MRNELNIYKSQVAAIWSELTNLLELAKKRKQEKKEIAEIIARKKRQREEEKKKKKKETQNSLKEVKDRGSQADKE